MPECCQIAVGLRKIRLHLNGMAIGRLCPGPVPGLFQRHSKLLCASGWSGSVSTAFRKMVTAPRPAELNAD